MSEKSTLESVVESLKLQVEGLQKERKKLDAQVKSLHHEVESAELDVAKQIAKVRDAADRKIAELQQEAVPYREQVSIVRSQVATLTTEKRKLEASLEQLKAVKQAQLQELDGKIAKASDRLARLAQEETAFRQRVAMV